MMPVHAFLFLIADIYVYHLEISIMIFDFFMIWLNFINYMTLNKVTCIMESCFYSVVIMIGFMHIKRVLTEQEEWLPVFFFAITFWGIYPTALY